MSGQLHIPASLPQGQESPFPIGQEAGYDNRTGLEMAVKRKKI
jgi:hypothetical protein